MKTKSMREKILISFGRAKIIEKMKKESPSNKEASETYRKTKKTISHIPNDVKRTSHKLGKTLFKVLRPHKAPILVATPFPPLNLRKIGKIWPKTGSMAIRI